MRRAQALEREFVLWEDTIPDHLRVSTVAWVDSVPGGDLMRADVCPGKVDMYPDMFVATMWNSARISRIFLAVIIIRCAAWVCFPVDYRTTPEYAQYSRVGQDMITNIIASIPFHLGCTFEDGTIKTRDDAGLIGGFFCIWPLICASCSDFTTDAQRLWIKGRFKFISETMGMNQAKVVGSVSHPLYPVHSFISRIKRNRVKLIRNSCNCASHP